MKFKVGDTIRVKTNGSVLTSTYNETLCCIVSCKSKLKGYDYVVKFETEDYYRLGEYISTNENDGNYYAGITESNIVIKKIKDTKIARKLYKNKIKKEEEGYLIIAL